MVERRALWISAVVVTVTTAAAVVGIRSIETGNDVNDVNDGHLAQLPALVAKTGGGPMRFPVFGAFWPDGTTWRSD